MAQFLRYFPVFLLISGILTLFLFIVFSLGYDAYNKKRESRSKRHRIRPPRRPSERHKKVLDISVYAVSGSVEPEILIYFYTEEKFIAASLVVEALYKVLREDYYDFETFEKFMKAVDNYVSLRDPSKKEIADKLRMMKRNKDR